MNFRGEWYLVLPQNLQWDNIFVMMHLDGMVMNEGGARGLVWGCEGEDPCVLYEHMNLGN